MEHGLGAGLDLGIEHKESGKTAFSNGLLSLLHSFSGPQRLGTSALGVLVNGNVAPLKPFVFALL